MNRLIELNNYSNETITYEDARDTNVIFNISTPIDQSITIKENNPHYLPLGISIREIINFAEASTKLVLDFSTVTDTVLFNTESLPAGLSITTLSPNVYEIKTFVSDIHWRQFVENVDILMPFRTTGTFLYTATIYYNIGVTQYSKSWDVTITIVPSDYITEPVDFTYTPNRTVAVAGPQITADEGLFNPIWTLSIEPSEPGQVDLITSAGSGGLAVFEDGMYTITGDKTQVNSHLSTLSVDFSYGGADFLFVYVLTNNITPGSDIVIQYAQADSSAVFLEPTFTMLALGSETWMYPASFSSVFTSVPETGNSLIRESAVTLSTPVSLSCDPVYIDDEFLSAPGAQTFYVNKVENMSGTPVIAVPYENAEEDITWRVVIADTTESVLSIASAGTEGGVATAFTPSGANSYKLYEIVGTKTQVNSHLNTLTVRSKTTTQSNFTLDYTADFGTAETYSVSFPLTYLPDYWYVESYPEPWFGDPWVHRTFLSNQPNTVFGDEAGEPGNNVAFEPNDSDYTNLTITLTAANGEFYNPANQDLGSTITIAGTYATIKGIMSAVEYWPTYGFASQETVTFTSTKDGDVGQSGTFRIDFTAQGAIETINYVFNTPGAVSWTPNSLELKYGKLNYTVVGGGGGGSYRHAAYESYMDVISHGGITVSNTEFQLGNASIRFDGVDDYLSANTANDTGSTGLGFITSGSFDAWVYLDDVTGVKYILDLQSQNDPNDHLKIWIDGTTLHSEQKGNTTVSLNWTGITATTWTHIAYQKDSTGGAARLFVNGTQVATASGDAQVPGEYTIYIGCDRTQSNLFKGYIDEIRFGTTPYVGLTAFTVRSTEYAYTEGVVIHGNIITDCPKPIHHDTYVGDIYAGHGGGGGGVTVVAGEAIVDQTYTGTIGAAGVNGFNRFNLHGTAGTGTTFNGVSVSGGSGATAHIDLDDQFYNPGNAALVGYAYYGRGGTSGNGYFGASYKYVDATSTSVGLNTWGHVGGGGGGALSDGYVATLNSVPYYNSGRGGDTINSSGGGGSGGANSSANDATHVYTVGVSYSIYGTGGFGYGNNPGLAPGDGAVLISVVAK